MKCFISVVLALLSVLTTAAPVDKETPRKSYACPPNFIRLSHRCYFFSKEEATWQDAFYQCRSMHSSLAIIKNSNQDKLIRKTLSRKTLEPVQRWLGGIFDWQRKQWKWAASGKPLSYTGFDKSVSLDEEVLQWNCIVIDPTLQFRWNARSCLERKHFICHKKIQTITSNRSRKKLMQQYNTNQLNEIPVPDVSNDLLLRNNTDLKSHQPKSDPFHIEIYPLPLDGQPAYRTKTRKMKKPKNNRPVPALKQFANGTVYENSVPVVVLNGQPFRRRRNRVKEDEAGQNHIEMFYRTYEEGGQKKHPLHPSPIVEEYNFAKAT